MDRSQYGEAIPGWIELDDDNLRREPLIRYWELNETSTRAERVFAAPSDDDLRLQWILFSLVSFGCAFLSLLAICGIFSSPKIRRNVFNTYLLFLLIPDFVFGLLCGITCSLCASYDYFVSSSGWMCRFQMSYVVFGLGANAWVNLLIAGRLWTMLRRVSRNQRFRTPSRRQAVMESLAIYVYVMLLGSLGFIQADWFPMIVGTSAGYGCIPVTIDRATTWFFWLGFCPFFILIPIAGVMFITLDVYKNNLLPRTGGIRQLSVFFSRLIIVFLVFWIPTALIMFLFGPLINPWVQAIAAMWSHCQGIVSALLTLSRPGINRATKAMLRRWVLCDKNSKEDSTDENTNEEPKGGQESVNNASRGLGAGVSSSNPNDNISNREASKKSSIQQSLTSTYRIREQALPSTQSDLRPESALKLQRHDAFDSEIYDDEERASQVPTGDRDPEESHVPSTTNRPRTQQEVALLHASLQQGGLAAARAQGFSVREAARYLVRSLEEEDKDTL